jgi:hypothetical protein
LWSLEEDKEGFFNGKEYKKIWRNIVPDHLAVLPIGSQGACSVQDGCGAPRLNSEAQMNPTNQTNQTSQSVVNQPASNPALQENCEACEQRVRDNTKKAIGAFLAKGGLQTNELSDVDTRTALEAALGEAYDGNGWCYILAVFSEKVVYTHFNPAEYSFETYQRSYSVAEGGAVSLGADVSEVRPETKYVPLVIAVDQPVTMEGNDMSKQNQQAQAPASPAANAQPQAAAAAPASQPAAPAESAQQAQQAQAPVQAAQPAANAEPKKAASLDELRAMASPEVLKQLDAIIKAQSDRAAALIKSLEGKIGLSADELKALPMESLEKMATKLNGQQPGQQVDFSGAAGASVQQNAAAQGAEPNFTPATPLFTQGGTVSVGAEKQQQKAA